jgi:hypothetical protein
VSPLNFHPVDLDAALEREEFPAHTQSPWAAAERRDRVTVWWLARTLTGVQENVSMHRVPMDAFVHNWRTVEEAEHEFSRFARASNAGTPVFGVRCAHGVLGLGWCASCASGHPAPWCASCASGLPAPQRCIHGATSLNRCAPCFEAQERTGLDPTTPTT